MAVLDITSKDEFTRFMGSDVALVDFSAPWCAPCRAMDPVIEKLCATYGKQAAIGKVDVDRLRKMAKAFGIQSIPTFIVFKTGHEINRFIGVQRREVLARSLESALSISEGK